MCSPWEPLHQPRLTLCQLTHEALCSSNKWKQEYRITANSPNLHCYMFIPKSQTWRCLFLGIRAKAASLQQVEIGHQHPLAGMLEDYKDLLLACA